MNLANREYICKQEDCHWIGSLHNIAVRKIITFTVLTPKNMVDASIEMTDEYMNIYFPSLKKYASLSTPEDIFWNSEKLSYLLENEIDAITIASAICELKRNGDAFK